MAQYYTGYNPERAFSDGMMAGYDFFDRIRSRRRALDLEERQQARADRGMELAENADARAAESHQLGTKEAQLRLDALPGQLEQQRRLSDLSINDTEFRVNRNPTVAAQQDAQHALSMDAGRAQLDAAREAQQLARDQRSSLADIAGMMFGPEEERSPSAMSSPPQPGSLLQTAQQTPASTPSASAGPVDLRTQPVPESAVTKAAKAVRGFVDRRQTQHANAMWKAYAEPSNLPHRFLAEPHLALRQYKADRNKLEPALRESWDLTIKNDLTERGRPIPAWLNQPVTPASAPELVADAGIKSPVKVSDERVVNVAQVAAANASGGPMPILTQDQMRMMNTQLTRMNGNNRLTPKQVETITNAARNGAISLEQVRNYSQYGAPFAPASPKIHNFGKGVGLMEFPGGRYAWLQAPGSDGASSTKETSQTFSDLEKDINGFIVAGQIDGDPERPAGRMHASGAISLLTANAPRFQQQTGIRVIGADGELDLSTFKNPQHRRVLIDWYNNTKTGERNPNDSALAIPNQDNAAALIPTAPIVGDVVDGRRYVGGPFDGENSWAPVN